VKMENQTGRKVKCLRTDNGTEYTNDKFMDFCEQHGIKRHFTVRMTPQQNCVVERLNRSIAERTRYLRLNVGLEFMGKLSEYGALCKVAEEVWTGNEVDSVYFSDMKNGLRGISCGIRRQTKR
jgi:transposase InsO family protein